MERQYTLRACGKKDEGRQYYLCTHHATEEVTKSTTVMRVGQNKKLNKCTIKHTFWVPSWIGLKAALQPSTENKGLANDRACKRMRNEMAQDISYLDESENKKARHLVDTATENANIAMNIFEQNLILQEENKKLQRENEDLKNKANEWKQKGCYDYYEQQKKINGMRAVPCISFSDMTNNDYEVKRRTGFHSLAQMLSYTLILCNGD